MTRYTNKSSDLHLILSWIDRYCLYKYIHVYAWTQSIIFGELSCTDRRSLHSRGGGHGVRRRAGPGLARRGAGDLALDGGVAPGVAPLRRRQGVPAAGDPRAGVPLLRRQQRGDHGDARGDGRRRARHRLARHHRARDAAVQGVDGGVRQDVPVVGRVHAGALRRRLRHGEAHPVQQGRAVRQDLPGAQPAGAAGQGPRLLRRRRLGAPPPRRAPGLHHGQAQDDDRHDGGVRGGDGPAVGGARGRGGRRDGAGGRRRAAFRGADRRRDLAHGVREQLQGREGGVRGAAGAPVHRLRRHEQRARPGPRVPAHQDQPPAAAAGGQGARHADGDHPRAAGRRQGRQRLRQRPARPDAGGQRVGRRRRAEGGRHEHGRDHRRVQDLLLRGARHHLAPPHLGRLPPRHAPGVAAQAQGGGPPGVRRRRDAAARRRAQQAQAHDNGAVRDAEAVRGGDDDGEGGDGGHGAGRDQDPQGHGHHDTDGDDAPGRGGVGRGRRRVQPGQVPERRGEGGEAPERDAGLLRGAEGVHRAGLRDAGGQVDDGRDPAPVRVGGGAGVRARAGRVPHAAAQVRPPRPAQALGSLVVVERLPL